MLINIETFILFPQKFLLDELINNAFLPLPGFGSRWQKESKCWCKYSGIATVKLNIKHWLSLMAQIAWWVKNCMIGAFTRIGQVSSCDQTTSCILKATLQWIELQILFKFDFDNGFLALTLILIFWLMPLYALQNRVLKPFFSNC